MGLGVSRGVWLWSGRVPGGRYDDRTFSCRPFYGGLRNRRGFDDAVDPNGVAVYLGPLWHGGGAFYAEAVWSVPVFDDPPTRRQVPVPSVWKGV